MSEGPRDERLPSLLGRSAIERPLPATADRQGVPHSYGLIVLLRRCVFHFFDGLSAAEREDILQDVIDKHQKFLDPEPMARCLIEEFREEVERTRLSHPDVEQRACSLEKTGFLVQERLSETLRNVRDDASAFV
jgi:hypothetical protein